MDRERERERQREREREMVRHIHLYVERDIMRNANIFMNGLSTCVCKRAVEIRL